MSDKPLKVWAHEDGHRWIEVYHDRKVRLGFVVEPGRIAIGTPAKDDWPILYRRDVPSISDAEWSAPPIGPGWREVQP